MFFFFFQDTVFFRLVDFCHYQGVDLRSQLPSPERLMATEELEELRANANVQFLIRTGYEHVQRQCAY